MCIGNNYAQATGFGCDGSGPYSRMWDDQMGWITNASGHILLRFDQPADREAFRRDLPDHPHKLLHPFGVNQSLVRAWVRLEVGRAGTVITL